MDVAILYRILVSLRWILPFPSILFEAFGSGHSDPRSGMLPPCWECCVALQMEPPRLIWGWAERKPPCLSHPVCAILQWLWWLYAIKWNVIPSKQLKLAWACSDVGPFSVCLQVLLVVSEQRAGLEQSQQALQKEKYRYMCTFFTAHAKNCRDFRIAWHIRICTRLRDLRHMFSC